MAYDKVVDSSVLNGYFSDIADAIRGKLSTQITYTPAQMAAAIDSIPVQKELVSIAVTHAPNKVTYNANQYFYKTGMVVTATYSDGSTSDVSSFYTYSPTGKLDASINSITITYTEDGITKTTTQPITVNRINGSISYLTYDLGGKVAAGGTANIYVSTQSTGAITATTSDSSKLTINSVSGKNISVTKVANSGNVQITVNVAQTNVYNAITKTQTLYMKSLSAYDSSDNEVTELNYDFQGSKYGEPAYVHIDDYITVYENGSAASIYKAGWRKGNIYADLNVNNNTVTIYYDEHQSYQGEDHIQISDNLGIDTNNSTSLEIPTTINIDFYD